MEISITSVDFKLLRLMPNMLPDGPEFPDVLEFLMELELILFAVIALKPCSCALLTLIPNTSERGVREACEKSRYS